MEGALRLVGDFLVHADDLVLESSLKGSLIASETRHAPSFSGRFRPCDDDMLPGDLTRASMF
jgi:hypothetical protein